MEKELIGAKELLNFCPNCGKENKNNTKFCAHCGTNLSSDLFNAEGNSNKKEQPKNHINIIDRVMSWWNERSTKLKALIVVIMCFLGVMLIMGVLGTSSDLTYSENGIFFNYPSNWEIYTPDDSLQGLIVALNTSSGISSLCSIVKRNTSVSVEKVGSEWYNTLSKSGTILSYEKGTVDGVKAFKITSRYYDPDTPANDENVVICFVKNGIEYDLIFSTGDSNEIQSDIDTMVKSFRTISY